MGYLGIEGDHTPVSDLKGVPGGTAPWSANLQIYISCPVPGYDRYFGICEGYGIRMPLTQT